MADANPHEIDTLHLLGITYAANMKRKVYTETIARFAAKKFGSI